MKDDWALCVGIEHYAAREQLVELPGALNDAIAIRDWLIQPDGGGVPTGQAKLIVSQPAAVDGDPTPTAAEIERFLRDLYRRAAQSSASGNGFRAGRRLWLFYSGHGLGFPQERDTGLLTADALPPVDIPHVAGYAWADVFRASAAFEEVVLFMDCCRTEANRIPLRRPMVKASLATIQGRMMAAYAVAESKAAFEVDDGGKSRGKFTVALEKLLRDPPERPISARRFLDVLDERHPGLDPYPPRNRGEDFDLITGSKAGPASLLIAHGETTFGLAQQLAGAMPSPSIVQWAGNVMTEPAVTFEPIQDLIVTRNLNLTDLSALVTHVSPRRTIVLGERDPGVGALPGVRFLPRDANPAPHAARYADQVKDALAGFRGTLVVEAREAVAHLRVWNDSGHVVGQGYGRLRLEDLPVGPYRVRASLGPFYAEALATVALGTEGTVTLPALVSPPAPERELARAGPAKESGSRRSTLRIELPSGEIVLSVPVVPGWTVQVLSAGVGASSLALRMIPPDSAPEAPLATDAVREALRLALAAPTWNAPAPAARELAGDPIALLLAAALQLRNGTAADELVNAAAAILGDDDIDIRLLRGGATVDDPPLLAWPWQHCIEEGTLEVHPGSVADGVVGVRYAMDPWFGWTSREMAPKGVWLAQLASAAWPGWDAAPDPALAHPHLAATCVAVGAPVSSILARAKKSPPVDRLVQHQRAAFVGASNDQLAAALVVAFVQRAHRPWDRIDVWSLMDGPLQSILSDGRTGARLLAARDHAEAQLRSLLVLVTREWSVHRYEGLFIDGRPHFASLWDWTTPSGYVHVSARTEGDVRTSDFADLVWTGAKPPARFTEVVQAYGALVAQTGLKPPCPKE